MKKVLGVVLLTALAVSSVLYNVNYPTIRRDPFYSSGHIPPESEIWLDYQQPKFIIPDGWICVIGEVTSGRGEAHPKPFTHVSFVMKPEECLLGDISNVPEEIGINFSVMEKSFNIKPQTGVRILALIKNTGGRDDIYRMEGFWSFYVTDDDMLIPTMRGIDIDVMSLNEFKGLLSEVK